MNTLTRIECPVEKTEQALNRDALLLMMLVKLSMALLFGLVYAGITLLV